ncbi:hypothetical protein RN001_006776 [Aquatica leii]|uniref:BTB domain-containing protein n=1 Tax=Aquatica leii TaxID=1421715 RepID=A0AAN7SIS5_9COLE|nr:hypothetical protein RN001_006776 [Aquatica leii]
MASEQFSLCWDNFHKNMSMGMQSLLETEDLVDVTLAVEGKYLKAHKMVLSVCSPYFRELFQTNPCKHPIVFMKDVSYIALSDLLHFMYQGEVQVAQENLPTFIKTAEALQVKGLTGDSGAQNDSESELEVEKLPTETTAKRVHDTSDPKPTTASRSKRFSGPASKRPKFSNVSTTPSTTAPVSAVTTTTGSKYEVASVNTNHSQSSDDVNLKMEPNESTEHLQTDAADDSQLEQYADDSAGFEMTDETEDFSLIESSNDDPKPGTSTEVGDNQDSYLNDIPSERTQRRRNSEQFSSQLDRIERKLDFAFGKIASIEMKITDLVDQLQDGSVTTHFRYSENSQLLKSMLPLKDIEKMKEFETILTESGKAMGDFKRLIYKVGGKDNEEHIRRVLTKIFADELAMKCSLQGKKGNFAVENSKCITVPKDILIGIYDDLTERKFNDKARSWFSFAKQRYDRSQKKIGLANSPSGCEETETSLKILF